MSHLLPFPPPETRADSSSRCDEQVPLYGGWPLPDPQNFDNAYTFAKQIQHIRDSTLAPAAKELLDVDGNPIPMYTGWPLPDASHFKDAKSYYEELKRMRQSTLSPGKNAPLYGGWPLPDPEGFSSPRAYAEEMARMHAEALKGASGNTDWDGNPVPVYQGWPLPDPATYSSTAKYAKEIQRMRDATLRPPGALQYWDGVEVPVYGGWPLPNPMEYESPEAYAAEIERMRYSTFLQAGELADWDGTKTPLYGGGFMNGPVEYNKAKMTPPEKVPAAVAAPHTSTLRDPSNLPEIDLSATVGEAKAAFSVADKKTAEATVEVSENVPGRVAEIVRKAAADAIAEKGSFTIAIAGGSLVKMLGAMAALDADPSAGDEPDGGDSPGMFGGFVNKLKGFIGLGEGQSPIEWDKFHVAWVDERCVPHDSPDSNYGGAKDAWLDHVPIPRQQIYPINEAIVTDWSGGQSSMADQVASDYEHQLRLISESVLPRAGPRWDDDPQQTGHEGMPVFDLLLLGFGPDGHICSLFPGHDLLDDESERWILPISDSPKPPPERITFSMRAVNSAKKVVLVGTGDGKAGVVGTAFTPGTELPCTMIAGSPLWLIDAPAASTLPATVPRQCSDEWKRALSIAGPAQAYSSEAS